MNGVTLFDAAEGKPTPAALLAVTVNVYAVPFVKPATTIGEAAPAPLMPPGLDVTVYDVIADPPLLTGAVKVTLAWALPPVAAPMIGAPGAVNGVTLFDAADAGPMPAALVAVTVKV